MAREIITRLVDDVDGSTAESTVKFAYDGVHYEIDLSEDNRARMRKALEPFIRAARRTGGRQEPRAAGAPKQKTKTQLARAWAVENGVPVPERGVVPKAVIEQYEQATA